MSSAAGEQRVTTETELTYEHKAQPAQASPTVEAARYRKMLMLTCRQAFVQRERERDLALLICTALSSALCGLWVVGRDGLCALIDC